MGQNADKINIKTLIVIVTTTIICLIVFAGIFIYFVTGVSATYPPIRKYSYSGSAYQLISGFQKYSDSSPDVTFSITDTTGNVNNNYALYMSFEVRNMEYTLKCEEHQSKKGSTSIKLVRIYDRKDNIGGYRRDTKEIDVLVDKFVSDILTPLKAEASIEIDPL